MKKCLYNADVNLYPKQLAIELSESQPAVVERWDNIAYTI